VFERQPLSQIDLASLAQVLEESDIAILNVAVQGHLLDANAAAAAMFRYSDVSALVADIRDIGRQLYANADDRVAALAELRRNGRFTLKRLRGRRRDGELFWARVAGRAQFGPDGTFLSTLITLVDITDLVEAQERAERAMRDYASIWDNTPTGLYRSSPDGVQLRANPALVAINGYPDEATMLANVRDIAREWYVDPTRRDVFKRLLAESGRVTDFVSEIHRHNTRERIWIREDAWEVRDVAGALLHYEGTVRDITNQRLQEQELRETNAALEQANRAKSAFLANMSHELRTPLNAILGFSEVIREQMFGPIDGRYRDYAADIHASGKHLLDLVNDILDLARIEAGRFDLLPTVLNPAVVVEEVTRLMANQAASAGLSLNVNALSDAPVIAVDARAFRQVLLNLLSNAIKFTPGPGAVDVTVSEAAGRVEITFADTGIGIPEHLLERVFEPFVQGEDPRVKRHAGTGLGLPIVKSLVERQGGAITLARREPQGTVARLSFPVVPTN
jgi:PAS domain S-box-containing protein